METIKIGNQEWATKNLNFQSFLNGDLILFAATLKEWSEAGKTKKPAWCYVNQSKETANNYGLFYNRYVIEDPRGIIPHGWKLPDRKDVRELKDCLNIAFGKNNYSKKIKTTTGWLKFKEFKNYGDDDYRPTGKIINPNGDNFTGLGFAPTGYRDNSRDNINSTAAFDKDLSNYEEGFHEFGSEAKFWMEAPLSNDDVDNSPFFELSDNMLGFSGWAHNSTGMAIRLIKI